MIISVNTIMQQLIAKESRHMTPNLNEIREADELTKLIPELPTFVCHGCTLRLPQDQSWV
jgi:hypothetical protein